MERPIAQPKGVLCGHGMAMGEHIQHLTGKGCPT
jgi:hypothetical protein